MKRTRILSGCGWSGVIALCLFLAGCGHDPNHGIDLDQAREAAHRVHTPPDPKVDVGPAHGG